MDLEEIAFECAVDEGDRVDLLAMASKLRVGGIELVDAAATGLLGRVAGRVGGPEETRHRRIRRRHPDQPDARSHNEHLAVPGEAEGGHGLADIIRDRARCAQWAILEQDREFVTTDPRHRVMLAHLVTQQPADLLQQRIASDVATGVIDQLEIVEIDIEQRMLRAIDGDRIKCALQPHFKFAAIDEVCQIIVRGLIAEPIGHDVVRRNILDLHDGAHYAVSRRRYRRCRDHDPDWRAGTGRLVGFENEIDDLAAE